MKASVKDRVLSRQESVNVDELHVIKSVGSFESSTINFVNDLTTEPQMLFYDSFSDRYFYSTFSKVLTAEYHANRMFTMFGTLYLNEFYNFLGIPMNDIGNSRVWGLELDECDYEEIPTWIEFKHEPIIHRNIRGYSISTTSDTAPVEFEPESE